MKPNLHPNLILLTNDHEHGNAAPQEGTVKLPIPWFTGMQRLLHHTKPEKTMCWFDFPILNIYSSIVLANQLRDAWANPQQQRNRMRSPPSIVATTAYSAKQ